MTSDQEQNGDTGSIFCAHCGTQNRNDTYSCDRCGERIYFPDPLRPPPLGLVECQNCTTANETHATYCVKCGNSLANAARVNVLRGGGDAARHPRSQPGGIRLRQRERERRPETTRRQDRERRATEPDQRDRPPAESRVRETDRERAQRESARAKAREQERNKSEVDEGENTSGTRSARLPPSARGWNTAAFLIGPIWGPANGVWLGVVGLVFLVMPESVLSIMPKLLLYLGYGAFLGYRGNELAWRARRWTSLEQFKRVQQQWMLLALVVNIALLFAIPILLNS